LDELKEVLRSHLDGGADERLFTGGLTPDLWLTESADDPAGPRANAVLDPAAGLGAASGALGLLQAAAAVAHLDEHGRHTVLATCGGPEDDGVAAVFLTGPHHTP
ncbi:hypothetical protein ABZ136_28855, partial [Streptomyces microflavus]